MNKRVKRLLSVTLTAMVALSSSSVVHKIKAVENPKDRTTVALGGDKCNIEAIHM